MPLASDQSIVNGDCAVRDRVESKSQRRTGPRAQGPGVPGCWLRRSRIGLSFGDAVRPAGVLLRNQARSLRHEPYRTRISSVFSASLTGITACSNEGGPISERALLENP